MTETIGPLERTAVPMEYKVFLENISPEVSELITALFGSTPIQDLAQIIENNPWHDSENALEHVQTVFANLQRLLKFEFIDNPILQEKYRTAFDELAVPEGELSRAEALLIACSLHDVSKGQLRPDDDEFAGHTYVFYKDNGETTGKGHEHASALLVPALLADSGLTQADIDHVQYLVENHDQFSMTFVQENMQGYETGDLKSDIAVALKVQPAWAVELLLHIVADEWGAEISQWKSDYLLKLVASDFIPSKL